MSDQEPKDKAYIVVVGPTASGKSQLAVALAHELGGEVVNADAMQVYRELNVGAAKLTVDQMCGIPHHLMDVVSVGESFTVSDFKRLAIEAIAQIHGRGHVPIVCGGTGLYINALTGKLDFTAVRGDEALRAELGLFARTEGKSALHLRLAKEDPATASRLHPNDTRRVIRALEVTILTGRPYAEQTRSFTDNAYCDVPAAMAGLRWEREALYARICRRVDAMMDSGLLEEAKALFDSGVPLDHPSMMGLGYRQLFRHLQGGTTLSDAIAEIKMETRRFAKRQMTWFSRDLRIRWFDMDEKTDPNTLLQGIRNLFEATNKHEEEKR